MVRRPCNYVQKKTVDYTRKLRDSLQQLLTDGHLFISNNLAERSIRSVSKGRKNDISIRVYLLPKRIPLSIFIPNSK
ncbi:IS66 family transposase [Oceanobacillus sojae]|uniref:IS66 family transposase n=1 Tax=Oceanobacillus sojae TaxID=582851 RepID=UPI0035306796